MDPYIGQIMTVAFSFAPSGWALALGQTMSISQNAALFSLLGTRFGGDGTQTFKLPNLGGCVVLGATGNYPLGQTGGQASVSLTQSQMPMHNHAAVFAATGAPGPVTVGISGSFSNVPVSVSGSLLAKAGLASDDNPISGGTIASVSPGATRIYAASSGAAVPLAAITSTGNVSGQLNASASGTVTLPQVTGTVTVGTAGASLPVDLLPPYVALNPIIALNGVWPSQN
jgi:microcystin-dependent protein